MKHDPILVGLTVALAMTFAAGAAFVLWRIIVSMRSGSIWLRGQNAIRSKEPALFWFYVAMYLMMEGVMLYGVAQMIAQ